MVRSIGRLACLSAAVALALAFLAACGSSSRPLAATATAAKHAGPCGWLPAAPAHWRHVVWIVMENKSYDDVVTSGQGPYEARLAATCGSATNFHAELHPSLPNYIAMTSGGTHGVVDDAGPETHPLAVQNLFAAAGDWRALQDGMPAPCQRADAGRYAVRHTPSTYYTGLAGSCAARDVPLAGVPDLSARFTFVTPDLDHDTHDTAVAVGDRWLAGFLPKVFASPQYAAGTTAVFLTWDEDDRSAANRIPTLVIAPSVRPGTVVATRLDHYALLRTTEELLGLPPPYLGAARTAPSMRAAFHL